MRLFRIAGVSVFASGLLWPLAIVAWNGYTLTGLYEESIGYRYFYNLRQIYEPATYLFLPQGQFTDVIQKVIHIVLSASGYPADELNPRIDYFAYLSIAAFHFITIAAFVWLISGLTEQSTILLNSMYWLLPPYVLMSGYLLLQPDYPAVEIAAAIVAAGFFLRTGSKNEWTRNTAIGMGIYLGAAAATKITLSLFPITAIAFAYVTSAMSRQSTAHSRAMLTILVGATTWLLILSVNLVGQFSFIKLYINQLTDFVRARGHVGFGSGSASAWPLWMFERFADDHSVTRFVYITPLIALLGFLGAKRDTVCIAAILTIGSVFSSLYLSQRDYNITLAEASIYLLLLIWVYTAKIWWPAINRNYSGTIAATYLNSARPISIIALAGYLVFLTPNVQSLLGYIERNTASQMELAKITAEMPGRYLWLVPDNNYRPASIDSAIMKGGSGATGQWLSPDSAIIRRLFPDVEFAFHQPDLSAIDINRFDRAFFTYLGEIDETIRLLRETFKLRLQDWSCKPAVRFDGSYVAICSRPDEPGS